MPNNGSVTGFRFPFIHHRPSKKAMLGVTGALAVGAVVLYGVRAVFVESTVTGKGDALPTAIEPDFPDNSIRAEDIDPRFVPPGFDPKTLAPMDVAPKGAQR